MEENVQVVPLHVHSEYSLLDGAIRIKDLVNFAKSNGMAAVALTDHGVMYGDMELYTTAKEAGIKPILGCEFYVHTGDITEHDKNNNPCYHLVLLVKNKTGYKNLIKLVSIAWCKGRYVKPRINWELIKEYHEGFGTQYFGYRLLNDGVEVDIGQDMYEGYQDQRIFFEIHYLDASKETWQFVVVNGEVNHEFGNKTNQQVGDDVSDDSLITVKGKNFDLLELSADLLRLTKSVYSDDLSVSDIDWAMHLSFDYTTTPTTYGVKIYGATQEKYDYVEQYYSYQAAAEMKNYTTEELNQLLANYHQKMVNAYSPNFYEVICIEYDVMEEVNHLLGLN